VTDELFAANRGHLLGVAYRLLGTMTDAEDVLQDVFERWLRADRSEVDNPAAYLTTMTTRASIDRLRSAKVKREVYVGPWLPEPVPTPGPVPGAAFTPSLPTPQQSSDPADLAELDESLTIGFLHLLERLTPMERAAYLLHDVFDFSYREVGHMIDRQEANCRQLASRARSKLKASRPDADMAGPPSPDVEAETCRRFVEAVIGGDVDQVMTLMTTDVVHTSDGGAQHRAARQPVIGPDRVARLLVNLARRYLDAAPAMEIQANPVRVNNQHGVLIEAEGKPVSLVVFQLSGNLVAAVYAVVNPDKLAALSAAGPETEQI
jgi:RNA polymerase sigma-70 factor (ECF subfamily)